MLAVLETISRFVIYGKRNLLGFLVYAVVQFNSMITNKPYQVPKIGICCLVTNKVEHVLVAN